MGKQYISTVLAAQGHSLDITSEAITNKYTITVLLDGDAKFWDNKQVDVHDPNKFVESKIIHNKGVHHVAVLEKTLGGIATKIVVVAFGCFDGLTRVFYYINDDLSTWTPIEHEKLVTSTWASAFYNNPNADDDTLVVSVANGTVLSFKLVYNAEEKLQGVSLEYNGCFDANIGSFPVSLAVLSTEDAKFAVGYSNGDVLLVQMDKLKIIYSFHSSDLKLPGSSQLIPRVLEFSPGGVILAVARDVELAGTITLYDVTYGENIGSLTIPLHTSNTALGGFAHNGWVMGLSFDSTGEYLASCGYDKAVRVWNMDTKEREATINISVTDLEDVTSEEATDVSVALGVKFIKKGIRGGAGGDSNDGLCVISFDRGVRWYREAGGI